MSVPYALDDSQIAFANAQDDAMTDVNTIIATVRTLLVTTLGWSEPSTALFKTPVDASSRFLDVLLTRISATNLEFRLRNAAAATVCTRRIQLVSGNSVWYYGSVFGVVISVLSAVNEIAQAHMLDQTPDLQSDSSLYVIGTAFRTAADANDGGGDNSGDYFAIDNGSAAMVSRLRRWFANGANNGGGGTNKQYVTMSGKFVFRDAMAAINSGGTFRWAGRICHALMCDSNLAQLSRRNPYIDTSTGKEFMILGLSTTANARIMFRSDG